MTIDEIHSVNPIKIVNSFLTNATYFENSHETCSLDLHILLLILTKQTSFTIVPNTMTAQFLI